MTFSYIPSRLCTVCKRHTPVVGGKRYPRFVCADCLKGEKNVVPSV